MRSWVKTTPWWHSAMAVSAVDIPLWRLVACARPQRIGPNTRSLIKVGLVGEDAAGASTDRIYPYDVAYGTLARLVCIPFTSGDQDGAQRTSSRRAHPDLGTALPAALQSRAGIREPHEPGFVANGSIFGCSLSLRHVRDVGNAGGDGQSDWRPKSIGA